ncbi:MAG TPA: serine/threonine-protein kinase [Actinomycetota bacterium]|nr:serine/threonine-protein kinase [Actinomycetota bacterium]
MPAQETERVVGSRYALEESIGRGGMGTVWRATDRLLQRAVAVKEVQLPATVPEEERAVTRSRVLREARAAASISHPGAVIVYDVLEEEGRPYIVMELVEAPTLEDVVRRDGPLDEERAARVGLEILGALEAAHAQGIVHRDVKPANVMLPQGRHAKLADFGIASVKGDPRLTATGLVLGSPSYMAPEQASEDVTGPASDLWSLGATLYYAVEGEPPFDRGQAIPTLTAVVGEEPRPLRKARALREVIGSLLEKDPAQRPSPEVLRRMLERALAGGSTTEVAPPPTEVVTEPAEVATEPAPVEPAPVPAAPRARPWLAILAAAGLLLVVAVLLFLSMGEDEGGAGNEAGRNRGAANERGDETDPEEPAEEAEPAGVVPELTEYEDPEAGYQVSYPEGWDVEPLGDTRTDFTDPETGAYLRMDWTPTPGDDPVAAWEGQSASFAGRYADYEEIRVDPVTFQGFPAAEWEYTYSGVHAINVGVVTDTYGYALNFQTRAEDWEESQALFEAIKETFVPAP